MPEDCAKHLGTYYNYDFEFEKNGITKKVEVKSIWGTDTRFARLIHSKSKTHLTSSCKRPYTWTSTRYRVSRLCNSESSLYN